MEKYINRSGTSGVSAYEIGLDYIRVRFSSGDIYKIATEEQDIQMSKT
jgi:hypothetical protein